ncbi:hypothetical protein SELMODRAFT_413007 [Selaginella moellendorffii]|uniref:Uncharacterized protein n=1 Tax=Selaginella moellendorffii TaxID=88036 RepID=D8RN18_SELML|nr:hypothetical protein SELMODRAFT_413007 [Selaginella moellendorffii]
MKRRACSRSHKPSIRAGSLEFLGALDLEHRSTLPQENLQSYKRSDPEQGLEERDGKRGLEEREEQGLGLEQRVEHVEGLLQQEEEQVEGLLQQEEEQVEGLEGDQGLEAKGLESDGAEKQREEEQVQDLKGNQGLEADGAEVHGTGGCVDIVKRYRVEYQ